MSIDLSPDAGALIPGVIAVVAAVLVGIVQAVRRAWLRRGAEVAQRARQRAEAAARREEREAALEHARAVAIAAEARRAADEAAEARAAEAKAGVAQMTDDEAVEQAAKIAAEQGW